MTTRRDLSAVLAAVLAAAVFGCSSARRTEPIAGPLRETSPQVARGEMSFAAHCQTCHTFGERSFAPALNNKPAPGWLIKLQVRVGLGAMPAFSKTELTPRDLDTIVAYLKALRHHKPSPQTASATDDARSSDTTARTRQ